MNLRENKEIAMRSGEPIGTVPRTSMETHRTKSSHPGGSMTTADFKMGGH